MAFPESRAPRRMAVMATALATAALAFSSIGVAAQDNATTLGSNEADEVPRRLAVDEHRQLLRGAAGITVAVTVNDHDTFQDQLNVVPAGHAGRHRQVVRRLPRPVLRGSRAWLTPISDVWAEVGGNYSEAFKTASTGNDGEQYFVPVYNYPWVVLYRPSVFEREGLHRPGDA